MSNFNNSKVNNKRIFIPCNEKIRANRVRVIDSENNNLGVISFHEAMDRARNVSLDLVQISDGQEGIPVCKITDYGKYKFEFSKKQKENAKKQRESVIKVKEISFRPTTDLNDLQIKANKAVEFINDGDRVKVVVIFKGRELAHKEVGIENLNKFIGMVNNSQALSPPALLGKALSVILERKKSQV